MKNKDYKFYVGCRFVVTNAVFFNYRVKVGDTGIIVAHVDDLYCLWFDRKFYRVNKSQCIFDFCASAYIKPLRGVKK